MNQTRNYYQRNSSWNAPYTFSGKEKDAETGYGYFGARYYDSGLSIWLSVDPMSDKYPSMSPYNYCANNPVMLVDPDGQFPYPHKGIQIYSIKANIGLGIGFSVGAGYRSAMAADRHGLTHFDGYYGKYIVNQNLYDGSLNPHVIAGGGVAGSFGFEKNKNDNFYYYLLSSSISISVDIKGIIGGGIGGGDESFCLSVGLGFELGLSVEQFSLRESISLSQKETSIAGAYSFWSVKNYSLKFDKEGSPYFEGTVYSNPIFGKEKNTKINVQCFAVKQKNGTYLPSKLWLSYGYKNSIERKQ